MLEEDDSDDSLELLLDTLCNAFGGIILITLLIALMSQEAHEAVIPPKNFRTQTLIQEQKILRMEGEIVIEEAINQNLPVAPMVQDDLSKLALKNRDLAQSRDEATSEIARLRERLENTPSSGSNLAEELSRRENELVTSLSQSDAANNRLQNELAQVRKSITESQAELSESKRERTQRLRLPKEKTNSSKKYLWVVVKHGKIYPVAKNEHFTVTQKSKILGGKLMLFEPKLHMGFDPSLSQGRAALGNYFRTLSSRSEYLAFEIFANDACFKAFNNAKELAAGMGIGYTWSPLEDDLVLTTSGGTEARPEQ